MSSQEIARTLDMSEYLVKEYIAMIEKHKQKEEKLMKVQVNKDGGVICRYFNMLIKILTLTLASTRPIHATASQLRGFFATKFNEYTLLHQHHTDRLIYRYPLVQYKIIDGTPTVIGINEGAEVLKDIYDQYDEINLNVSVYEIVEQGISVRNAEFGLCDEMITYRFATPWFALNQDNYKRFYLAGGRPERAELLNRTLAGNILSMSKSLDYQVPDRIICDTDVRIRKGRQKDINIMTFTGTFRTNFLIPDYLGIGKSVSCGFGAVVRINDSNSCRNINMHQG